MFNGVLNQYLQNYVNNDPRNWGEHLSLVDFYYNSTTHSMTKMSPFELPLGKEIRKLVNLAIPMGWKDHSKEVVEMVKRCEEYTQAKKLLE